MADLYFGGGLNESDPFNMDPSECLEGGNFVIDARRENFRPRKPQDLKGTATNGGCICGIMQMIDRSDVDTMIIKSDNIIYSWDGSTFTSEVTDVTTASRFRSTHWGLDDLLIVTDLDKNDPVYKWDGTSFLRLKTSLVAGSPAGVSQLSHSGSTTTAIHSTHGFSSNDLVTIAGASDTSYNGEQQITVSDADTYTYTQTGSPTSPITTSITADLGVELKAKYSIVKDGRVWLFNINTGATALPHAILASKFEDPQNFDTAVRGKAQDSSSGATGTDPFFLLSPDLKAINGVVEFFDQVVISTVDGGLYKLTGTSPTDYNFIDYYKGSAAHGTETMVNTGNDVFMMRIGGDIDKLSDTDRSGDLSADDATSFLPLTKLNLDDPQAVYDQTNQRVLWFEDGFVLAYDKTAAALVPNRSPWMKWTTLMPNNFTTKSAAYVRLPGLPRHTVLWGDSIGQIFDLNGTGYNGDAGAYNIETSRTTRFVSELPSVYHLISGRVQYRRTGACDLVMSFNWGEEYATTVNTVPLKGPVLSGNVVVWSGQDFYWNENDYWNEGTITGDNEGDNQVSTAGFSAVGKSIGFFLKTSITTTVNFLVDKITT